MSAPTWLEWIKPAPKDAEELEGLVGQVCAHVEQIRKGRYRPNWRAVAAESRVKARKYRAAVKALTELPEPAAGADLILDLRRDLEEFAASCDDTADSLTKSGLAPKRKGGTQDVDKFMTALGCETILIHYGKDASDANTARLALWVWNEAHERAQDERQSDVDAWETTVRRAKARTPNGRLVRHESKPR